jgi:hypothetical protein
MVMLNCFPGGSAAIAILAFVRNRNSGKQRKKQPATRCSSFVKPSAVQDFRGLRDVDG